MPTLRELVTKFSFQTDLKPLNQVARAVDGIKSRLNLLVGVEAIKGIAALTDRFGTFALDLRNAAAAAGLSTDEFQKLGYAAAQAGLSQEAMGSTLKSLNKRLQDARLGSEQAALSFAYAGISPEQVGNFRNAEDALYALGRSLNSIQDPVRRAASAQELLGEQGLRLLGSLSATKGGLRELAQSADAAANVVSGKNIEALARAQQSFMGLKTQVTTLAVQLGAALAPAITTAVKVVSKFISANQAFIRLEFKTWARRAAFVLGAVAGVVAGLAHDFALLAKRIYAWGQTSGVFAKVQQGIVFLGAAFKAMLPVVQALGAGIYQTFADLMNTLAQVGDSIRTTFAAIAEVVHQPLDISTWLQAFDALGVMIANLARAPFAVIVSAMQNLYGAADKLYQLLFGGNKLEDSYLGKWARAFGYVSDKLGLSRAQDGQQQDAQAPTANLALPKQAQPFDMMRGAAPTASPLLQGDSTSSQTINAPITLNIQGDANSAPVLQAVKEGVAQHFDLVMRQSQASTAPGMVY